jgi:hypothetical protein
VALEAPLQVFLTATMLSMNINPPSYQSNFLKWLPVVSMLVSLITIFISLLKTTADVLKNETWFFRLAIVIPIFVFRMVAWQLITILLADLIFVVIAAAIIVNTSLLLILQKNGVSLEPFSYGVQSLVFPMSKLISKSKEDATKIFGCLIISGNLILMTGLAIMLGLCSLEVYDAWNPNSSYSIVISKFWCFKIAYSMIPMCAAATVPLLVILHYPRYVR